MDWNDLQHLMALAHHGNLPKAADALAVNRTTIARRIERLEAALGVRLVEKVGRDLALTRAGQEAVAAAELMDGEIHHLARSVFGRDEALDGLIRLTLTSGIGCLLAPDLARFQDTYPSIRLEISATNATEDLDLLESDVAVRFTTSPPDNLIGRLIGRPMTALYASKELAARLDGLDTVDFIQTHVSQVLKPAVLGKQLNPVISTNSIDVVQELIACGKGVSPLPCYLGEKDERLVRISDTDTDRLPEIWLLYPTRLRSQLKIRRFIDFLVGSFDRLRPVIEGQSVTGE